MEVRYNEKEKTIRQDRRQKYNKQNSLNNGKMLKEEVLFSEDVPDGLA